MTNSKNAAIPSISSFPATLLQITLSAIINQTLPTRHSTMPFTKSNHPNLSTFYLFAGAYNLLIIPFSIFFSNNLGAVDELFSPPGCFVICLWGFAYISVHELYPLTPQLSFVFGVEKAFFGLRWLHWISTKYESESMELLTSDFWQERIAGLFFALYGAGDIFCSVFFFYSAFCFSDLGRADEIMRRKSHLT
mmetsp:Transcript_27352/g.56197  ORF Transcript_27352/g.56197 Transcript_27352/m.56197 type:complete len:193 (+) Transcript_27352:374-952(+)